MELGTQFSDLVLRVRAELRRSTSVSVAAGDADSVKETINHVYQALYQQHDWPHLRKTFDKVTMVNGTRYYNVPSGLDMERIEHAVCWYNGEPHEIHRGIGFPEYSAYDSTLATPEKTDPVLRYDFRWTGSATQIEVWPVPASATTIQFIGMHALSRLTDDADACRLDATLVVMFAAAELMQGQEGADAQAKLAAAQDYFRRLKGRLAPGNSNAARVGLGGNRSSTRPYQAVVRISG